MQIRLPCLVSGAGAPGDSMGSGMQPASCRFYFVDKTLFFPEREEKILPIPEKAAPVRMKAMRMSTNCGRRHAGLLCQKGLPLWHGPWEATPSGDSDCF